MVRSYSEAVSLPTFEARFRYLQCPAGVGKETFGSRRFLNQALYCSKEWRELRNRIIVRDGGGDLAFDEYPVRGREIIIHHINPITPDDILNRRACIFDPENLICVSEATHRAIHYGNADYPQTLQVVSRSRFDTCPWKKER